MTEQLPANPLVERLRDKNRGWHPDQVEAAAEIERLTRERDALRAENERLREALKMIESGAKRYWREGEDAYQFAILARAALETK